MGTGSMKWPDPMRAEAFHGIAGDFVHTVQDQTEADPAGLLMTFLAACGSAVGNSPSISISGQRHTPRIWPVLVGSTASGRKGTTFPWVQHVVDAADPTWRKCMASNVGSGEAVLWKVRDAADDQSDPASDQGGDDKRLFIMEGEFASVLQVAARAGSVLSPILRSAWDSDRLTHTVKHQPVTATGAHIVVVGHITPEELQAGLQAGDRTNGFGNRFLFILVKRARTLPRGGEIAPEILDEFGDRLRVVLDRGRLADRLDYSEEWWDEYTPRYEGLSDPGPGIVGAMTGRGAPYVHRLGLLFALLDGQRTIGGDHARAALAIWDYSAASAAALFAEGPGAVYRRIVKVLEDSPEGITRADLHTAMGGHATAADLNQVRDTLVTDGRMVVDSVQTTSRGGRPGEMWRPLPRDPDDEPEGGQTALHL